MGLRKRLLLLAASFVALNAVLWAIMHFSPEVPEPYKGVAVAPTAPTVSGSITQTPPPLPPGFPSMERPPPKIKVPDGQPQPIATKFGLTYDVPADWDVWQTGVAGWTGNDGTSVTYGSLGFYNRTDCSNGEHSELAMTGMTGRRTQDLQSTALAEVEKAEMIFSGSDKSEKPSVTINGPEKFSIDNLTVVRYRAIVENIPEADEKCSSDKATFDVIATAGYATAETAVLVIRTDRDVEDALHDSEIDDIISTIRKS